MKSVFKTVAPIAMTITFALSGVAMADTATTAAKSADSAKATTAETAKPSVHHHKHKAKVEAAKNTVAPANTEKSVATKPATVEKVAPTANSSKKVEPTKA
jgi:hypothetical protein